MPDALPANEDCRISNTKSPVSAKSQKFFHLVAVITDAVGSVMIDPFKGETDFWYI